MTGSPASITSRTRRAGWLLTRPAAVLPAVALYAPEHPALLALPCWIAACLLLARPLARAAIARCREDAPRLLRPMLAGAAIAALILLEQHGAFAPGPATPPARREELRSVARSIHLALQRGEAEWRARQAERTAAATPRPEGEKP